jgi:hypothetical protein
LSAVSSSSDSNTRQGLWERHYREASERRRARGWHRRHETTRAPRHGSLRLKVTVAAVALFLTLAALVLLLPR